MTSSDAIVLQQVSNGLAEAVGRASGYTVLVNARRRIPASGVSWGGGLVVTTDHALEREEEITVGLPDDREVPATLVGRDPRSDLAVLRVEGATDVLVAADRAPDGAVRVGALVLAIGRPTAGGVQASLGAVSAIGSLAGPWLGRRGREGAGGGPSDDYVRAETTLFPGFSGGPLVDVQGRMVGLNTSRGRAGVGVTIPAGVVARLVESLAAHGRIRRAYLGIGSQATRLPAALAAHAGGREAGLLIVGVEDDSPAARSGLIVGDIIIAIDDAAVGGTNDLQSALAVTEAGATVSVHVLRGGEPREVSVTLGERP